MTKYIARVVADRGKELYYDEQEDRQTLEARMTEKIDNPDVRLKWVKSGDVVDYITITISIFSEEFEDEHVKYVDYEYL